MRKHTLFLTTLLLACAPSSFAADDDGLSVSAPFKSQTAQENFRKCFKKVDEGVLKSLEKIDSYSYALETAPPGCPPTKPNCRPGTQYFRVVRRTDFEARDLNPAAVNAQIRGSVGGGCSFSWSDHFRGEVGLKSATYRYRIGHTKRFCDNLLGTWDISKSHVNVTTRVSFNPDGSVTTKHDRSDAKGNVFGFIPMGILDRIAAPTFALVAGDRQLMFFLLNALVDTPRSLSAGGFASFRDASSQAVLNMIGRTTANYRLNYEESGFQVRDGNFAVEYAEDDYLEQSLRDGFERDRKREIAFVKDLSNVGPESVRVEKGDSYWNLIERKFGDGRIQLLARHLFPEQKVAILKPGQNVMLPRWQDVCDQVSGNPLAVQANESLWKKAEGGQVPRDPRFITTLSGDPNLIFPFEVLQVSETRRK